MGLYTGIKFSVGILMCISWILNGLLINCVQLVLYLTIFPFSKRIFRKLNYYLVYSSWSQLVAFAEWWSDARLTLYFADEQTEAHFGKEHSLTICNHRYEVDWLWCWMICDKYKVLGSAKSFAKASLKWIPVIGWTWIFCEIIFLQRSFEKDQVTMNKSLDELMSFEDVMTLLLFSEGTRFTADKYQASVKFAESRGLPQLKYHLQPRTRGFVYTIQKTKDRLKAVYSIQLAFDADKNAPNITNVIKGLPLHGHFYVERFPVKDIPSKTDEEVAQFLVNLYQQKDAQMETFFKEGKFHGKKLETKRRLAPFIHLVVWFTSMVYFFYNAIVYLVATSNFVPLAAILMLLFSALVVSVITIRSSKAKRGSSYGTNKDIKKTNNETEINSNLRKRINKSSLENDNISNSRDNNELNHKYS